MYHEGCLRRWTDRVPTCPQCRRKGPDARRLYPTLGGGPDSALEPARLAVDLDNERLQLRLVQEQLRDTRDALQRQQAVNEEVGARAAAAERAGVVLKQQTAHYKRLAGLAETERDRADGLQQQVDRLETLRNLLHAGVDDVELLLAGEPDPRTLATFSVALRRALADAQRERATCRTELQRARRDVRDLQDRLRRLERPEPALPPDTHRVEFVPPDPAPAASAPVAAPAASSPYLRLRQAGPALALSVKPSEQSALRATPYSIFGRGARPPDSAPSLRTDRYDGLGGRAPHETAPAGRARPPRLSARHRLRDPTKDS